MVAVQQPHVHFCETQGGDGYCSWIYISTLIRLMAAGLFVLLADPVIEKISQQSAAVENLQ